MCLQFCKVLIRHASYFIPFAYCILLLEVCCLLHVCRIGDRGTGRRVEGGGFRLEVASCQWHCQLTAASCQWPAACHIASFPHLLYIFVHEKTNDQVRSKALGVRSVEKWPIITDQRSSVSGTASCRIASCRTAALPPLASACLR